MDYVIYLDSKSNDFHDHLNAYGYWSGKSYLMQKVPYPICDKEITGRTKRYKSYKNAVKASEKCLDYTFVSTASVRKDSLF